MDTTVTNIVRGYSNGILRTPYAYAQLACGHSASEAPLGAVVACDQCDWQVKAVATLREALSQGLVAYTRAGSYLSHGRIHVYQRNRQSPTGVQLLVTVDETPEVLGLLRGGLSPLSPRERA